MRQIARAKEVQLVLARPVVIAHRRKYFKVGVERTQRNLEAHLVVAGRGAPVSNGGCAVLAGNAGQTGCLDAALGTDAKRIQLSATDVAGNQEAKDAVEEILPAIDKYVLDRTEAQCSLPEGGCRVFIDASGIDCRGDDVAPVRLLEPRDAKRGIEAARKCQYDGSVC
jgi:hypothetical protein